MSSFSAAPPSSATKSPIFLLICPSVGWGHRSRGFAIQALARQYCPAGCSISSTSAATKMTTRMSRARRVPDHPQRPAGLARRIRGKPDRMDLAPRLVGPCWGDATARADVVGPPAPVHSQHTDGLRRHSTTTHQQVSLQVGPWMASEPNSSRTASSSLADTTIQHSVRTGCSDLSSGALGVDACGVRHNEGRWAADPERVGGSCQDHVVRSHLVMPRVVPGDPPSVKR